MLLNIVHTRYCFPGIVQMTVDRVFERYRCILGRLRKRDFNCYGGKLIRKNINNVEKM